MDRDAGELRDARERAVESVVGEAEGDPAAGHVDPGRPVDRDRGVSAGERVDAVVVASVREACELVEELHQRRDKGVDGWSRSGPGTTRAAFTRSSRSEAGPTW